jgi:hypothetical protein
MQGDDLGVFGILWGTAIAFALSAVTMVDSGRQRTLTFLWAAAVAFLVVAVAWPWIAEKWPEAKAFAQVIGGSQLAVDVIGPAVFGLLAWDFSTRRRWLSKEGAGSRVPHLESKIDQTSSQFDVLNNSLRRLFERLGKIEELPASATTDDHDNLRTTLISAMKDHSALAERLDKLENNVVRNNGRIHEYEHYHLQTMNGLIEQLDHSLLFDSTPRLPAICSLRELSPENIFREKQAAEDYWKEARSVINDTKWSYELRSIEAEAKYTAERAIRDIPVSERPAKIRPDGFGAVR